MTLMSPQALRPAKVPMSINDYEDDSDLHTFCLAFRPDNRIHLFPPTKQTALLLRETVAKHWTLEADTFSTDCYTLSLKGTPFLMYSRRENAMLVKLVCCLILERFKTYGWTLVAWTDLSRKMDLTAWYFTKGTFVRDGDNAKAATEPWIICLSLSAKQNLQLINAPPDLHRVLYDLVDASYDAGIEREAQYGRDYQIKLKGTPWDTEVRDEITAACELISDAFSELERRGYHFYGSVNLKVCDQFMTGFL